MRRIIISDASCIILFEKIGQLQLLNQLFGEIVITPEISNEFGRDLPDWVLIDSPRNKTYQTILEASLDKVEASAIALAIEQADSLLILDDLKGRKYATELGLKITGAFGLIIEAKNSGLIDKVKPILESIKNTNFRLSAELEEKVLKMAGEA